MIKSGLVSKERSVAIGSVLVASLTGLVAGVSTVAAVALPVGLALALCLYAWPVLGVYLFAGTIPLETALTFGGVSSSRLIGMTVFGVWAAQKLLRREPLLPLVSRGLVQFALVLFAVACLSLTWAEFPQGVGRLLFLLFQLILLAVLVVDLASSWEKVAWVAKLLVISGTIAALLTIEQFYLGGARRAGGGIVGGLNTTAYTMVIILPFAFYLLRSSEGALWRLLGLSYIGLAALAVTGTMSRMNLLMYPLVVLLHMGLMARTATGRRAVFVAAMGVLLAGSFLPMDALRQRVETIAPYISETVGADDPGAAYSTRGYLLRLGVEMFRDRPLLGHGYHSYTPLVERYQFRVRGAPAAYAFIRDRMPHSSYVYFLACLGIVGFLLWLAILLTGLKYLISAWRRTRHSPGNDLLLVEGIAVSIGLMLVFGLYNEVHQDKIVWLVLGLAAAVHRLPSILAGAATTPDARRDRDDRVGARMDPPPPNRPLLQPSADRTAVIVRPDR